MSWQVIVDFDGTISRRDTTDLLLQGYAEPQWVEIEEEWLAGRIGSRECMSRQIELIRMTTRDMRSFIEGIEIDWHFKSFVRQCQRHDLPVTIVSDGLDHIIHSVLERSGLENLQVRANQLQHEGGDRWSLSSPNASNACHALSGTCKCSIAAQRADCLTLVIGDGRSDRCVAQDADFVFAKAGLVRFCEEKRLPFQAFRDFAHASTLLNDLMEMTPVYGLAAGAKEPAYG